MSAWGGEIARALGARANELPAVSDIGDNAWTGAGWFRGRPVLPGFLHRKTSILGHCGEVTYPRTLGIQTGKRVQPFSG